MLLKSLNILYILLFIFSHRSTCNDNEYQSEGQRLLKPDEIIRLVATENRNIKKAGRVGRKWEKYSTQTTQVQYEDSISDTNDDLMKAHKVWSRWGKWGECSVTCGEGVISRCRLCVAGRCAPGEIEEQRRPCNRTPCATALDVVEPLEAE